MKLRTTTPDSKSFLSKVLLILTVLVISFVAPLQYMNKQASADRYDTQINTLQQQINNYNAQAASLKAQADTYQNAVAQLQGQVVVIQSQIDLSQTKYDKLTAQIADTEKKIQDNKDALGTTIANLYIDGSVSPIEMLASSKNISDYLDKQQYQNSVRDQLTSIIKQIQDLKTQLDQQKTDVKSVLDRQTAERTSLDATRAQQQDLLNQTQGQEAAYQQLVSASQQKLTDASNAQKAYYDSLVSSGGSASSGTIGNFQWQNLSPSNGSGGCSGGYPYCQAPDSAIDPWKLYNRECVSYVAWALTARFSKYVAGFNGQGNAQDWPYSAPAYSGAVRVYDPQPGDAVILPGGTSRAPIGHAMVVESVSSDGWIHVSQFNFYGTYQYSTMDIRNSGIVLLRFQNQ
jgi:peptidoglycan hydrolase CwlO-like protein